MGNGCPRGGGVLSVEGRLSMIFHGFIAVFLEFAMAKFGEGKGGGNEKTGNTGRRV